MESHREVNRTGKNAIDMNKLLIMALAFFWGLQVHAQEKPLDSKITQVTIFLNRAQVTREAKTRIEAGETQVIIKALPAQLDPQSIQVEGKGKFVLVGVSHRQNFLNELNTPRTIRQLQDSVSIYQKQIAWEESQKELLNKEEQMLVSNQRVGGTNQNLTVAELKGMADFFRARLGEIALSRVKSDDKVKKNQVRIAVLQQQLQSQNELFSRNSSELVISLSADAPTVAELQVSYVVQQAGWYPVYELRALSTTSPLALSYKANVFQSTGEDWKNVKLRLSTGNPAQSGLKPELYPWYLNFYQPIGLQKRSRTVAKEATYEVATAGAPEADELAPAASAAEFVNAIQTALNTTFDIALPYTVISSNQPTVVDIQQHQLRAEYSYAVVPKLEMDAFLLAKATGWEELNLLPGEANIFFEGAFVGKSYIDPNNTSDTLSISLGRDPRIVVKRDKLKDLTTRGFAGVNKRETHAWEISIRNTKSEAISITVEDQLPVSQNSQIEVSNIVAEGAKRDAVTGKLTWELKIQSNQTSKVGFRYEVKYPKDRRLNL